MSDEVTSIVVTEEVIALTVSTETPSINLSVVSEVATVQVTMAEQGPAGAGLPTGGATNQRLVKKSAMDYDYEWANQSTAIDKQILFQDGDVVSGDDDFRWDKNTQSLIVGKPDTFTNDKISIGGALDDFLQATISNTEEGISASADWIATNDKGTDDTHYIDMGINSSVYDDPEFDITKANDSYLLNEGGDLIIAPVTEGKKLILGAGGSTSDDIVAEMDASGMNFNAGKTLKLNGVSVAPVTNRPEILSGTGEPPEPTGLSDGTLFIKYTP